MIQASIALCTMAGNIIILLSIFVGLVHGRCSSLEKDIDTCFTNNGLTYSANGIDTFSTYLKDCSKVTEIAACVSNALGTCDTITSAVPDAVGIRAAYNGVCANKAVFQAGATCIAHSSVDVKASALSCLNSTKANSLIEKTSYQWQTLCSVSVTGFDCLTNGLECSPAFKTAYKNYAIALLPSKCRQYSKSLSPWIETYGTAITQVHSLTLITIVTAVGVMTPYVLRG